MAGVVTRWGRRAAAVLAVLLLAAACGRSVDVGGDAVPAARVEVLVEGLLQPTQLVVAPDGRWVVAELNGEENAGTGRVVVVDPATRQVDAVLLDGLDKPTGVAVLAGELWVMQRRSLVRATYDAATATAGEPEVVLDGLPFNGRSEGTLTVTPAGTLLYATSGSERGGEVVDGSGVLWELDPAQPGVGPTVFATGLKNAYAHVALDDGTVVTTEIGDGTYDGQAPLDEVVHLGRGDDAGWPTCTADGAPVADRGGTVPGCSDVRTGFVTFAPGATPTGVALLPDGRYAVALWVTGEVVVVAEGADPVTWVTEVSRPQHLVVDGDRLLVVDHATGQVLALDLANAPG